MMKPLWGGKYPSEGHPGDQACRSCRAIRAQAASLEGRHWASRGTARQEKEWIRWRGTIR